MRKNKNKSRKIYIDSRVSHYLSLFNGFLIYGLVPIIVFTLSGSPGIKKIVNIISSPLVKRCSTNRSSYPLQLYDSNRTIDLSIFRKYMITDLEPLLNNSISNIANILTNENLTTTEKITKDSREIILNLDMHKDNVLKNSTKKIKSDKLKSNKQNKNIRNALDTRIHKLRLEQKNYRNKNDLYKKLTLAIALYNRDLEIHDGGSVQEEAIDTFISAIQIITKKRNGMKREGKATNITLHKPQSLYATTSTHLTHGNINDELFLTLEQKSIDGLLVEAYCHQGKQYYLANMFESSLESYDLALEIEPYYIDALSHRASTLLILGRYEEAAKDYNLVLKHDINNLINDVYIGLARILVINEDIIEGGWDYMINKINFLIPQMTKYFMKLVNNYYKSYSPETMLSLHLETIFSGTKQVRKYLVESLKNMHLTLFHYHDNKTFDKNQAWKNLLQAYQYKMSILKPYDIEMETKRHDTVMDVFRHGFWSEDVGNNSTMPIFIIGFVRSGSTLLERILDAHPLIVGTGEDSIFNGRLDIIRNAVVRGSITGKFSILKQVIQEQADKVLENMKYRWIETENQGKNQNQEEILSSNGIIFPKAFVDKMLTNYMNVGFIHLLFPKALILHISRNPMDTLFSAFKHDFPPGGLDYTSDFTSLAHMYRGYRDIMDHWDAVLPDRVTHLRYEDMVADMPGVAKAVIRSTGLKWDDDVLNFYKKKQAVNTLSTTQVRNNVYRDSVESWKRYELQLQPLVKLVGSRISQSFKTTLPGFQST